MLYYHCSGPACHNHEHAKLQRLLQRLAAEPKEALRIPGIEPPAPPETIETQGTHPAALASEWNKAAKLAGDKATPILWLDKRTREILDALRKQQIPPKRIILFAPAPPPRTGSSTPSGSTV